MKTITNIAALATALLIGSASLAVPATRASAQDLDGITWEITPGNDDRAVPSIEFTYGTNQTAFPIDAANAQLAELRTALAAPGGGGFTLRRDPGVLRCDGAVTAPFEGHGRCAFAYDASFEADLRSRDLELDRRTDLLAMALLGVDRALIDGLAQAGVPAKDGDEVIAAAALGVTPEYVVGLKRAGLELNALDDAIACRALDVTEGYVRAMAEAGYRADAEQIIAMKATGVTAEYARRMNAAIKN